MSSQFQLVRYKHGKHQFEVAAKPGTMTAFREGKAKLNDVAALDSVFKSFSKGEVASEADLKSCFGEDKTPQQCLQFIFEHGEFQMSSSERQDKMDQKKKEVVNYIHKYYLDPSTKKVHPVVRIEAALQQIKARIDPDKDAERQAQDLISKLCEVIPLKKTEISGTLCIPHAVLGPAMGVVAKYATASRESYDNKGMKCEVTLVPGDYDALMQELSKVTKGDFQFEIAGQQAVYATSEEPASAKAKTKAGGSAKGKQPKQ